MEVVYGSFGKFLHQNYCRTVTWTSLAHRYYRLGCYYRSQILDIQHSKIRLYRIDKHQLRYLPKLYLDHFHIDMHEIAHAL